MTNTDKELSSSVYVGGKEPTGNDRKKVWIQKGKNLFDKNKALLGYWISTEQGDIAKADNDVFITDFIPVFKNVPVYIPATGTARRQFYNKNKVGITYLNNSKAQVFTPAEDGFIRVTCVTSTVTMDNLMIYYGTTETEYEAYIEPKIYIKNSYDVYEEFIKKSEEVYSTVETKIGTWVDGKPLYRKVLHMSDTTSGGKRIDISNLNYEYIMIKNQHFKTKNFIFTNNRYNTETPNDFVEFFINNDTKQLIINVGVPWANFETYIIIEYTKITD